MLDGDRAKVGQLIWPGDTIGLVGSTGKSTGNHLHYSVIKDDAGKNIGRTDEGGSIGISVNDETTLDPAGYGNYDPTPRYLNETPRAAQIMSGTDAGRTSGGRRPDRENSFGDRFGNWASAPANALQPVPSDRPESFDSRFGSWGSAPAGDYDDAASPVLRGLQKYKRSAAPGGPRSLSPGPIAPDLPSDETQGSGSKKPVRYLTRRIVNNSPASVFDRGAPATSVGQDSFIGRFGNWTPSPGIAPRDPNLAVPPPESSRPLGLFTGKPMPEGIVPLPLGALSNNSDAPNDIDWLSSLAGISR